MPKILKEELRERLLKRGEEMGVPDLIDRIADESVGITEDEILPFLTEKDHPAPEDGSHHRLTKEVREMRLSRPFF
jgi:CO dehydrogenase/acetyl-CoA synthase beta subunit